MDYLTLTLLAHLSAHRRLLVNLYAGRCMNEEAPAEEARRLRTAFDQAPTQAPEDGSGLDPATSDLLAAMTDEMIQDILSRVISRVEESSEIVDRHNRDRRLRSVAPRRAAIGG